MCCRSLLLTGYRTQFVPTSFTAHSMSMLVTIPHWLSCNATNTRFSISSYSIYYYHRWSILLSWGPQTSLVWYVNKTTLEFQPKENLINVLIPYLYSDWDLSHCVNRKSLLLVLCKCQPALIFQSYLIQQMEQSGEQWLDWQREGLIEKKKKKLEMRHKERWSYKRKRCTLRNPLTLE